MALIKIKISILFDIEVSDISRVCFAGAVSCITTETLVKWVLCQRGNRGATGVSAYSAAKLNIVLMKGNRMCFDAACRRNS